MKDEDYKTKGDGWEVTKEGLFQLQICTSRTDIESVAREVEAGHPCGTSKGWTLQLDIEQGVQCSRNPNCKHYMLAA